MCWLREIALHVWRNFFKNKTNCPLLDKGCVCVCEWVCALINECVHICRLHKSIYAFGNLELNYPNSNWNSSARRWVSPHFDGFVGWSFDPEQRWSAIESLMTTHCFVKRKMFCSCLRVRLIWVWRDLLECPRVCASSLNEADKERCGKNSPSMRLISGPVPVPNTILICLIAYYRYIWVAPACPVPLLDALQICAVNCNRKVN